MEIDVLRFGPDGHVDAGIKTSLKTGNAKGLEEAKKGELPLVYVVRTEDLEWFRMHKDLVEDRRRKHRAKGLSSLLLGRSKMPLIDGGFTSAGRLAAGIRALLSNAKEDRNLYIIGADDKVFGGLLKKANSSRERTNVRSDRVAGKEVDFTCSLNNLLGDVTVPPELKEKGYIGESKEAELVRKLIILAAKTDDPVLILGDTGTGKEIVARQIHEQSARKNHRFVTVNCGAISPDLFESELFGHVKGAFTGAIRNRMGLWREAGDGTLFLDEIGDLSVGHQKKILRAIQEKLVRPIGEDKEEYRVNASIIAATNRDLYSMMQTGQFREDLYYRLCGFIIQTPALRDHKEDIPPLARFIWKKRSPECKVKDLPEDIISMLKTYSWPGNVRELKKVLANLHSLFYTVDRLCPDHLKAVFRLQGQTDIAAGRSGSFRSKNSYFNVESLRHLRQAAGIIRSAEITIKPLVEKRMTDKKTVHAVHSALQHRLNELDRLCEYPLRFHNQAVFDKVKQLESKLIFFRSLLKEDVRDALRHWEENSGDEFGAALSAVLKEIEKVIRASSG